MTSLDGIAKDKNKINIVYAIDSLGMGGAERLTASILKNLSTDFSPRVCVFNVRHGNPIAEKIKSYGFPVDFLYIPYMRDITAIPRLMSYLKNTNADLVHGQLELGDIFGCLAAKLLGLPSVSTLHTMPSQEMNMKLRLHQSVEFFALRYFCDTVISVSNEARQFYMDISNLNPLKLRTIYNGIDLSQFSNLDRTQAYNSVRNELGLPLNAKILTTVAVLRELKGIQFMIRALASILPSFPDVYYLIVGDGEYKDELKREAEFFGIKHRVIFAGQRDDVNYYLAASDQFILPTLTEALPTVLAEAMAARLPIVASAVGGIPEMITNGENGVLVPAGNVEALVEACSNLLSDEGKARLLGEAGWLVANRKFNVHVQVNQLQDLYLELIRNSRKSP